MKQLNKCFLGTLLLITFVNLKSWSQLYGITTCNTTNVSCSDATWGNEKKAVALILGVIKGTTNYIAIGTGTLLNNTCDYNTPYVITAYHLSDAGLDPGLPLKFVFGYWSSTCTPTTYPQQDALQFFTATKPVASSQQYDYALYQLNAVPLNAYYAGWSYNPTNPKPTSVTCLYHPNGDIMKIAKSTLPVINSIVNPNRWVIQSLDKPTQGGASGCGIFDQNKKWVGELYGTQGICTSSPEFNYIYNIWSGIRPFLDPYNLSADGTVALTVAGKSTTQLVSDPNYKSKSISGPSSVTYLPGQSYTPYNITGLAANFPVSWQSSDPTLLSISGTQNSGSISILKNFNGAVTISATINTGCGFNKYSKVLQLTGLAPSCGQTIFRTGIGVTMNVFLPNATQYRWRIGSPTAPLISGASGASYTYPINQLCPNNGDGTYFNGPVSFYVEAYRSDIGWSLPCLVGFSFNCNTQTISALRCGATDPSQARPANASELNDPLLKNDATIFPNPSSDRLNIVFNKKSNFKTTIQLLNATGSVVQIKHIPVGTLNTQLDISLVKPGVYFLRIQDGTKKLVYKVSVIR